MWGSRFWLPTLPCSADTCLKWCKSYSDFKEPSSAVRAIQSVTRTTSDRESRVSSRFHDNIEKLSRRAPKLVCPCKSRQKKYFLSELAYLFSHFSGIRSSRATSRVVYSARISNCELRPKSTVVLETSSRLFAILQEPFEYRFV